jgi:hypothetical protein
MKRKWALEQSKGNLPASHTSAGSLKAIVVLCSTLGMLLFAYRMYGKYWIGQGRRYVRLPDYLPSSRHTFCTAHQLFAHTRKGRNFRSLDFNYMHFRAQTIRHAPITFNSPLVFSLSTLSRPWTLLHVIFTAIMGLNMNSGFNFMLIWP